MMHAYHGIRYWAFLNRYVIQPGTNGKDLHDIKQRLSSLERGQARNHAEYAELHGDHARQQSNIDTLSARVQQIGKRLELTD